MCKVLNRGTLGRTGTSKLATERQNQTLMWKWPETSAEELLLASQVAWCGCVSSHSCMPSADVTADAE